MFNEDNYAKKWLVLEDIYSVYGESIPKIGMVTPTRSYQRVTWKSVFICTKEKL
jgi:hypothetical protein